MSQWGWTPVLHLITPCSSNFWPQGGLAQPQLLTSDSGKLEVQKNRWGPGRSIAGKAYKPSYSRGVGKGLLSKNLTPASDANTSLTNLALFRQHAHWVFHFVFELYVEIYRREGDEQHLRRWYFPPGLPFLHTNQPPAVLYLIAPDVPYTCICTRRVRKSYQLSQMDQRDHLPLEHCAICRGGGSLYWTAWPSSQVDSRPSQVLSTQFDRPTTAQFIVLSVHFYGAKLTLRCDERRVVAKFLPARRYVSAIWPCVCLSQADIYISKGLKEPRYRLP